MTPRSREDSRPVRRYGPAVPKRVRTFHWWISASVLAGMACASEAPPFQERDTGDSSGIGGTTSSEDGDQGTAGGSEVTATGTSTSGTETSGAEASTSASATAASGSDSAESSGSEGVADDASDGPAEAETGSESGGAESSSSGPVEGCGGEEYDAEHIPPNVLILLDRSYSMTELIDGTSRWDIALAAIDTMAANYEGSINFGLALYPGTGQTCDGGEACTAGDVFFIDPAPQNAEAISTFLDGSELCDGDQIWLYTPTGDALESIADYPALEDGTRENFLVIVTDGAARCGDDFLDPTPQVELLREQTPEIQSFVVGFGSGVDPEQLTNMAAAGGRPRAGDPNYYQADDAVDLESALAEIAGTVVACDFSLSERPFDPTKLYVYIDGEPVAADPEQGWTYDAVNNSMSFAGASCEALQDRSGELRVIFGCPLPS